MSFIQITDTHFIPLGELLYEMSPQQRLADGIQQINARKNIADFVIATGDLAHFGEEAAYESLKDTLDRLEMPYHLLMGNHDSRAPFLKVFKDTPVIEGGFIQFTLETTHSTVVCLDSLNDIPGDHIGMLCNTRLKWLADEISKIPEDRHFILAAHHPFFKIGVPSMDSLMLRDSEALLEVLQARKPDMFLFGHVHRPITGVFKGIPFHTQFAFNHQVTLQFDANSELAFSEENPDYAVIRDTQEGITVFTESVGGELRRFEAGSENRQTA